MSEAAEGDRVESASRALDLMEVVAGHEAGSASGHAAAPPASPRAACMRCSGVLTARGYLDLDEASRLYTLGVKVWENGQSYLKGRDLVREARPVMEAIAGAINETVQLARLDGTENVYLAKVDTTHPLRLQSEVGARLSAHATGLGKALLACLADDEVRARFGKKALPRMTPGTIVTIEALIEELTSHPALGVCGRRPGIHAGPVLRAVPIRDHRGQAIAAVSVSVPLLRLEMRMLARRWPGWRRAAWRSAGAWAAGSTSPSWHGCADPAFAIEALVERGHGWSWVSKG